MSDRIGSDTKKTLVLANIQDIDRGRVALAFNQALQIATQDCINRPGDKGARKIQLTVELKPQLDKETSALDTISTEFVIKTTVPVRRSAAYPMLPLNDGKMVFQPGSPFDPRQSTFNFAGSEHQPAESDDDEDDRESESPM